MKKMTSTEIRNMWYEFFVEHGHKRVESAPLIPKDDDSLLWINAGVTPLKKYFDGRVVPDSKRLVNVQKCIRTNDIENVGRTSRHQTFFEMMGNFSIGDYFRKEAITMAYELLTSEKWFGIPKELLYVTIYTHDEESFEVWTSLGLDPSHIVRLEGNFWEIGEGPCGPDSEIFYDRGERFDADGTAFTKFKNDEDQDRYVEIWNNVFSQFNAEKGVKRENYKELPHKNIDTGAGLERWACIFQGVDTNFDTDLFQPIIKKIEDICGTLYNGEMAFKVIADHARAITMALSDGAVFENTGRGYVLRRLLRRSVRYGKKLGINEPFVWKLVDTVIDTMKESYPALLETESQVKVLVLDEENLFYDTLAAGEHRLEELMKKHQDTKEISGKELFKLYDTYGFPFELAMEYLEEASYTTNQQEFDACMAEAKELAKKSAKKESSMNLQNQALLEFTTPSTFVYGKYKVKGKVTAIISNDDMTDSIDRDGYVIFDQTCFYATSGGQVADTGMITCKKFKARVLDVFKGPNGQNIHKVKILSGTIHVGDEADLLVDKDRRLRIECNHSSVHILQNSLQEVLGDTVHQAGSYVDENYLRFDFTYPGKITDQEILDVEALVNDTIKAQIETETEIMSLEDAKKTGAMALFDEKYGDEVRVVTIGNSKELCGGTHTSNTRNIGSFAITNLESKGSNVYRVQGATGNEVEHALYVAIKPFSDEKIKQLLKAKEILTLAKAEGIVLDFDPIIENPVPTSYKDVLHEKNELGYVLDEVKRLDKEYKAAREKKALGDVDSYVNEAFAMTGIDGKGLVMKVLSKDTKILKDVADECLNRLGTGFVFFANVDVDKATFVARSNISLSASDMVKDACMLLGGNGGGSKTFATGGAKNSAKVDEVLSNIKQKLESFKGEEN